MTSKATLVCASGSSLATVSAPVIGDEYVLVKKNTEEKKVQYDSTGTYKLDKDSLKDDKKVSACFGLNRGFSAGGGRFGQCKALLTYDFSFTPSTSSTLQTSVALAPAQDNSFTSHWKGMFSEMRMDKAEVELDFTEYMSSVGHDVALSPMVWAYVPTTIAATMYYADVSDFKTANFIGWSTAKPVVRYKIPPKWLKTGWTDGQVASTVHPNYGRWMATQVTSSTFHQGVVHICSQKAMFDTERVVVGRLKMWMTFRGQF